ncbi:MAG: FtsQ-type POTRA domain-containing protein [Bacteroidota bacterium]
MKAEENTRTYFWLNIVLLVLLLSGIVTLEYYARSWSRKLHIRTIILKGNIALNRDEVLPLLSLKNDSLLLHYRLEKLSINIQQHTWVKTAKVTRIFPSTLRVDIEERIPVAITVLNSTFYLDNEGCIMKPLEGKDLLKIPVVSAEHRESDGKQQKQICIHLLQALNVVVVAASHCTEMYYLVSEVHTKKDNNVVLYTLDSAVPIEVGKEEFEQRLQTVLTFWKNIVKDPATPQLIETLDARFKNRVVVRWKQFQTKNNVNNG